MGNTVARCVEILVREDRPLSQAVAGSSGVRHESPQVICFIGGEAVQHASHHDITMAVLKKMVGPT